jgi:hypothetical protein
MNKTTQELDLKLTAFVNKMGSYTIDKQKGLLLDMKKAHSASLVSLMILLFFMTISFFNNWSISVMILAVFFLYQYYLNARAYNTIQIVQIYLEESNILKVNKDEQKDEESEFLKQVRINLKNKIKEYKDKKNI